MTQAAHLPPTPPTNSLIITITRELWTISLEIWMFPLSLRSTVMQLKIYCLFYFCFYFISASENVNGDVGNWTMMKIVKTCLETSSTYCTMSLVLTQWLQVLPRATVAARVLQLDSEANSLPRLQRAPAHANSQWMNECLQRCAIQKQIATRPHSFVWICYSAKSRSMIQIKPFRR